MARESGSDADLIRQVKTGDREAFGTLVGRYLRPGLAVAWEYADSLPEAEDLVQDAFYRALRRLDRFDEGRPFPPWFFTIVRNLGRNLLESRGRWKHAELVDADRDRPAGRDPAVVQDVRSRIDDAVEALPFKQRACFRLCEIEGFTSKEVADMLNMSDATVRVHVHRARLGLRERLSVLRDGATGT